MSLPIASRSFYDAALGSVRAGQPVDVSGSREEALRRNGLLMPKNAMAPEPRNQMLTAPLGKARVVGEGQPSSASPPAPASPQATQNAFERGGKRRPRNTTDQRGLPGT